MFYFLNYAYNPNTAATNRALAYLKGLSELGIQIGQCPVGSSSIGLFEGLVRTWHSDKSGVLPYGFFKE